MTIALGVLAIVGAVVWHVWCAPRWTNRIAAHWTWRSHFVGVMTWANTQTVRFPERDTVAYYDRLVRVAGLGRRSSTLVMEDTNTILDAQGRRPIWQYTYRAEIDARTGAYISAERAGEFYVFPRNVQRRTYTLRQSYVPGIPLAYQRVERLEDVVVYLFAYRGRGEYTASYTTGTREFPALTIPQGHQIRCADDQFVFRVWVEPVTGEIVKLQESCRSGDYVYNGRQRLHPVARWSGESAGDDVRFRLEHARAERLKVLWLGIYTAPVIFCLGVGLVLVGVRARSRS